MLYYSTWTVVWPRSSEPARGPGGKKTLYKITTMLAVVAAVAALAGPVNPSRHAAERQIAVQHVDYVVSAEDLYTEYAQNQVEADAKYKGRVIMVTGAVGDTRTTVWGVRYVMLMANAIGSGVECRFADGRKSAVLGLRKGQHVTIRGKCEGKPLSVVLHGCRLE